MKEPLKFYRKLCRFKILFKAFLGISKYPMQIHVLMIQSLEEMVQSLRHLPYVSCFEADRAYGLSRFISLLFNTIDFPYFFQETS